MGGRDNTAQDIFLAPPGAVLPEHAYVTPWTGTHLEIGVKRLNNLETTTNVLSSLSSLRKTENLTKVGPSFLKTDEVVLVPS